MLFPYSQKTHKNFHKKFEKTLLFSEIFVKIEITESRFGKEETAKRATPAGSCSPIQVLLCLNNVKRRGRFEQFPIV